VDAREASHGGCTDCSACIECRPKDVEPLQAIGELRRLLTPTEPGRSQ
jgi:succinate dehydrogenase/fumarate reductase-like Fe-S protein